jgi:hypothetical protein
MVYLDEQIQYFNSIMLWLLDLHGPLCSYVVKTDVNPWYNIDVERAMIARDIAYQVWKRRRTAADRIRYKEQCPQVNYLVQKANRLNMGRFLSPDQPPKKLWRYLGTMEVKKTVDYNIIFTPDQLNTFFATPTVIRPSANNVDPVFNSILTASSFPMTWKLSKVMPK